MSKEKFGGATVGIIQGTSQSSQQLFFNPLTFFYDPYEKGNIIAAVQPIFIFYQRHFLQVNFVKIKTVRTIYPATIFLALLTACAGGPRNESLETATADDGRKIFTYKVEMPMPDGIGRQSGPTGSEDASRRIPAMTMERETQREQIKVDIYTRFQDRIEQSGYCPNGYSAGQVQLGPVSVIDGECVEPR